MVVEASAADSVDGSRVCSTVVLSPLFGVSTAVTGVGTTAPYAEPESRALAVPTSPTSSLFALGGTTTTGGLPELVHTIKPSASAKLESTAEPIAASVTRCSRVLEDGPVSWA